MEMLAKLIDFCVRVQKVKTHNKETGYAVFSGVVMAWRPKRKEWVETRQRIVCVGNFYSVVPNDLLQVKAEEIEDVRYGNQYQIYTSKRIEPGTEVEMKKFLTSIKGVGTKNAELLIDAFGMDVISTIVKDPSCLNTLKMTQKAKEAVYEAIVENQAFEQLLLFLRLNGLRPGYAMPVYRRYGDNAVDKIRDNPYALYLDDVLDFQSAGQLDNALGGNTWVGYRVSAGLLSMLRDDCERNGNLYFQQEELTASLEKYLAKMKIDNGCLTKDVIDDALRFLFENQYIIVDRVDNGPPAVYLSQYYYAERRVANRLAALIDGTKVFYADNPSVMSALHNIQKETGFTLAPEQYNAVRLALTSPVSIITGGPGTGKTQTLTMLTKAIRRIKPSATIRLCAPTGKAAVRMQEVTNIRAATIHRLVGFPQRILEENELKCDFLIVDEFSMSDMQMTSWLFTCLDTGARLVIVGDYEQLPSVGPGLVLRDMIDSGCIAVQRLTKVYRQDGDSRIISNAHAIINAPPGSSARLSFSNGKGGDFYFVNAVTQTGVAQRIKQSVQRLLAMGFPISQIEVLSPIHAGIIGDEDLNVTLQELVNPGAPGYQVDTKTDLRVGDKVIQTTNDYDLAIFNGEVGIVKAINFTLEQAVLVEFPHKTVWYDSTQVGNLALAYAITTHRAQGSEFQAVVIPVHESLEFNMTRTLFYTAITRAKKIVILVGSREAMDKCISRNGIEGRASNLIPRLRMLYGAIPA